MQACICFQWFSKSNTNTVVLTKPYNLLNDISQSLPQKSQIQMFSLGKGNN